MFKIYGGDTKFTQWTKNQKLIMSRLPLGAEVLFYNDPKEDEPLVTEVYEYTDENGISFHVCDVPNIFLTDTKRIKVRIPSKVVGLYGIVHSYVGQLERYFEVEPAEKPADYVYEETTTEGCEGQIQADLSQTDSAQVDYVKGVIRQESLPEGYPYKEMATILDGTFEFADNDGIYAHRITDENFFIVDGKSYTVIWDGITYQCVATTADNGLTALGNLAIYGAEYDTGEPFLFMDQSNVRKVIGTNDTAATHTITVRGEVAYPIAPEFLPKGYPYTATGTILEGTFEFSDHNGIYMHLTTDKNFAIAYGKSYTVIWDGVTYQCVATNYADALAFGNLAIAGIPDSDTGEPFLFADGVIAANNTAATHTITVRGEVVYPIASEFLPDEYVTETELASKGYLTAIPSNYVTETELASKGYLTSIPNEYVTETELASKGYLTSYTETDPTVPAWAKAKTKPSYDFSELTVNDPEAAKTALTIENGMILKNLQAAMPSSYNWYSITYGNGKFVAIALRSKQSAYSEDGISWTLSTMPYVSDPKWVSVIYGNGKFIALALGSYSAYSEDGINWTLSTMPNSDNWYSVTYANGKFVAVAYNSNKSAYSEDGINWTASTMPRINSWYSVTCGNGKFVAVANNFDKSAYSEDGISWTLSTMPSSDNWYSITYGNGKFVAIALGSNHSAYSEDGINWTLSTVPSTDRWFSITYGNGKFVAVANNSNQSAYSEDGISWTLSTMPSSAKWRSVTYGNGKFVAVAEISDQSAYSEDGINWKTTFEYISQNESDITESVRSVINNSYGLASGLTEYKTKGDGSAYTVSVDGITSLTAGISFIMIPHAVSTSVTATLDVNGLGAKTIRRPISANTSTTVPPSDAGWLDANKPIRMTYDGTYWVADLPKPYATDIYGTVPVANGGVPACTTADNGKVLKVVDGVPTWVEAQ